MKVLLIDDHPLILAALQSVLGVFDVEVSVVGVTTARAAREALAETLDFDLILLDLTLGDADGFELLTSLRETYPALPVVVLSASERMSDVLRSVDLGAMGFVPKRASNEQLFDALNIVLTGGIYVPAMLGGEAVPPLGIDGVFDTPPDMSAQIETLGLTRRQKDVLTLLLQGKANKLIARELNLSVETVKDHVAAVLRTLKVNTRTQAVLAVGRLAQQASPPQPALALSARR